MTYETEECAKMFSKQKSAALKNLKYIKELLGLFTLLSAFTVLYSLLIFLVYPYTVKEIKKKTSSEH